MTRIPKNRTTHAQRFADAIVRFCIRAGYRVMRVYWRKRGVRRNGVGVVIRHRDRVLAVRHSYRPEYTIPGGGIGRNETPAMAAARELGEELSLAVAPEDLIYVRRLRVTHLMELRLDAPPDIRIDNREIIDAVFLTEEEAVRRNPSFQRFLER